MLGWYHPAARSIHAIIGAVSALILKMRPSRLIELLQARIAELGRLHERLERHLKRLEQEPLPASLAPHARPQIGVVAEDGRIDQVGGAVPIDPDDIWVSPGGMQIGDYTHVERYRRQVAGLEILIEAIRETLDERPLLDVSLADLHRLGIVDCPISPLL